MFGSIFYNLWGALIAFSLYFFMTLQQPYTPLRIIIGSFVAAIIVFFVMYIVRFLIAYVLFTPTADPSEDDSGLEENSASVVDEKGKETSTTNSTVEFQDESTEDIAQTVRTMMHREDEQQVNA
ncbi:hypothetical protein [Lysinibacillus tabacifolii]|uniref:Multidrug transporter n=1 Tax=Lysinibacillus tabacifolii TaxID=1173107 RepID=A0ABY2SYK1_9BACI|nr:hypothetical protein [Lysinibacillus tabacifolii]TKI48375.1 hypothetical protein FC748_12180 [Lysinibacillus tabacifolii]